MIKRVFDFRPGPCLVFALVLLAIHCAPVTTIAVQIEFDYTYDTDGFLDEPKRELLEIAAGHVNRYVDRLSAIVPTDENSWFTFPPLPPGGADTSLFDMEIPADTIRVIVGGNQILPIATLSATNVTPSSFWMGSDEWDQLLRSRGQPGALETPPVDFGGWGGVINFNSDDVDWHFGVTTDGLESHETDFLTVVMHELMHIFGFGPADSFQALTDFNALKFNGLHALGFAGASNPELNLSDGGHWALGTLSFAGGKDQEALMVAEIPPGKRKFPTLVDRAALRDVGWQEALAGDVDLDGDFDRIDIVTVAQRGKYLSGEVASWIEGDWNDDFRFDNRDILAALIEGHYLTGPYAAVGARNSASFQSRGPSGGDSEVGRWNALGPGVFSGDGTLVTVPEPTGIFQLLLGVITLACRGGVFGMAARDS